MRATAFIAAALVGIAACEPAEMDISWGTGGDPPPVVDPSLDPFDRASVARAYNEMFVPLLAVEPGWSGDINTCDPGTLRAEYHDAVVARVNFFRALVQLPGVELDPLQSEKCQAAAVMFSAQGDISHTPPNNWACWTAEGAEAAGSSNIGLGRAGVDGVNGFIDDGGANNTAVGHRRWLLYPPLVRIGSGAVPAGPGHWSSNLIWVIGNAGDRPAEPETVTWPSAGFLPYTLLPESGRWSFSHPGASFSGTTVTVLQDGVQLDVATLLVERGYGDDTLVFLPTLRNGVGPAAAPPADVLFEITFDGVWIDGAAQQLSYSVTVFDPGTP